jgi:hypothetical protein
MTQADYYPEWRYGPTMCRYEGHDFGDGGSCQRCGERLRCHICGRFIRIDTVNTHYLPHVPVAD